jgi:hypothetical protein
MEPRRPLAVVSPTLEAEVLAHLVSVHTSLTASQLAGALPRGSLEGVRRTLARLVAQGVVLATPVGARGQQYRFNREHVAAPAIAALSRLADEVRSRLAAAIEDWQIRPVYAALFGSWAGGSAVATSDLDIFLMRPEAADGDLWDAQVAELEQAATAWTGNDARVFAIDDDQLEDLAVADDPALIAIVREGLPLYGDHEVIRRRMTHARRSPA